MSSHRCYLIALPFLNIFCENVLTLVHVQCMCTSVVDKDSAFQNLVARDTPNQKLDPDAHKRVDGRSLSSAKNERTGCKPNPDLFCHTENGSTNQIAVFKWLHHYITSSSNILGTRNWSESACLWHLEGQRQYI